MESEYRIPILQSCSSHRFDIATTIMMGMGCAKSGKLGKHAFKSPKTPGSDFGPGSVRCCGWSASVALQSRGPPAVT